MHATLGGIVTMVADFFVSQMNRAMVTFGWNYKPFGWNYKPAEKHCWLIFCERKILFRLKKQAE
jgi:hypothetical protein